MDTNIQLAMHNARMAQGIAQAICLLKNSGW